MFKTSLPTLSAALFAGLFASSSDAAVVTYLYTGEPLDQSDPTLAEAPGSGADDFLGGSYVIQFSLDESILGQSYRNLNFSIVSSAFAADVGPVSSIVAWFASGPGPGGGFAPSVPDDFIQTAVSFSTDASGNIFDYDIDFAAGPPDGRITTSGDSISFGADPFVTVFNDDPGTWQIVSVIGTPLPTTVIPVPATGLLALGALGLLGGLGAARRRMA
ncbi:MAG: hypothetical protein AAF871_04260 [Pseudomonadota bacterium]